MARNGGIQYASTSTRRVPMHDPACAAKVIEHVSRMTGGDSTAYVEEKCGRYTRGAHKGALRGWASITVVEVGGWKKNGPGEGNGRVVRPGTVLSVVIADFNGREFLSCEGSSAVRSSLYEQAALQFALTTFFKELGEAIILEASFTGEGIVERAKFLAATWGA